MTASAHTFSESDERFMARAIALARAQLGRVAPNPAVGCVIVRDGLVLDEAFPARLLDRAVIERERVSPALLEHGQLRRDEVPLVLIVCGRTAGPLFQALAVLL